MSYRLRHQFAPDRDSQTILGGEAVRGLPSFNFGVFSLRPSALESDVFDRLCEMSVRCFSHALYLDQSAANLVFVDSWERLPFRLNYNPSIANRFRITLPVPFQPRASGELVYHFFGVHKPWHKGHPFERLWRENFLRAEEVPDFSTASDSGCRQRNELSFLFLELAIRLRRLTRVIRRHMSDADQKLSGRYRRIR